MTVAVTGGSGVVGRAVVRHLVAADRDVRALARSGRAAQLLEGLGATAFRGDILDESSLAAAFRGAEVAYHIAGVNQFCMRDPAPMYEANVEGTRNVVRACETAGVRRLVYTSSAIVLGEEKGTVGVETSPHRGRFMSHYEHSKHKAEGIALSEPAGVEVVAVNPSSVQGPGRATGTGKLILDVINGKLPVLVDSTLSVVDIDDCARGHLLAERHGTPGERYILNGFSMPVRAAIDMLSRVAAIDLHVRYIPSRLMGVLAPVVDLVHRVKPLPFCGEMIRAMVHGHTYDGSKARRHLKLDYTPAETTLARTVDWFRSSGLMTR